MENKVEIMQQAAEMQQTSWLPTYIKLTSTSTGLFVCVHACERMSLKGCL